MISPSMMTESPPLPLWRWYQGMCSCINLTVESLLSCCQYCTCLVWEVQLGTFIEIVLYIFSDLLIYVFLFYYYYFYHHYVYIFFLLKLSLFFSDNLMVERKVLMIKWSRYDMQKKIQSEVAFSLYSRRKVYIFQAIQFLRSPWFYFILRLLRYSV